MEVIASLPYNTQQDTYLNGFIRLSFDEPVSNYFYVNDLLVGNYFQLYEKTTNIKIGVTAGILADEPNNLYIQPIINLNPNIDYIFIVIGGVNGIQNEQLNVSLSQNYVLNFKTGTLKDTNFLEIDKGYVIVITPEPTPAVLQELITPIRYEDLKKLPEIEEGTDNLVYDFSGDDSGTEGGSDNSLFLDYSIPENYSWGNPDTNILRTFWNKYITQERAGITRITKTPLPFDTDPYADHTISILQEVIIKDEYDMVINNSGLLSFMNTEIIVTIPPGVLVAESDTTLRNKKTVIIFAGILSPMFATVDSVKGLLQNNLDIANPEQFDYMLAKKIQLISYELTALLGYQFNPNDPNLFWASRYVACRVAFEMTMGPFGFKKTVSNRTVLGQSISYHVSSAKSITRNPLEDCMNNALAMLGLTATGAYIGVKSGDTAYYPGRKQTNFDFNFNDDVFFKNGAPVDNVITRTPSQTANTYKR